jgi:hypothetical protein
MIQIIEERLALLVDPSIDKSSGNISNLLKCNLLKCNRLCILEIGIKFGIIKVVVVVILEVEIPDVDLIERAPFPPFPTSYIKPENPTLVNMQKKEKDYLVALATMRGRSLACKNRSD